MNQLMYIPSANCSHFSNFIPKCPNHLSVGLHLYVLCAPLVFMSDPVHPSFLKRTSTLPFLLSVFSLVPLSLNYTPLLVPPLSCPPSHRYFFHPFLCASDCFCLALTDLHFSRLSTAITTDCYLWTSIVRNEPKLFPAQNLEKRKDGHIPVWWNNKIWEVLCVCVCINLFFCTVWIHWHFIRYLTQPFYKDKQT